MAALPVDFFGLYKPNLTKFMFDEGMEAKQNREIQKDFVVPNPRPRPGPHGKNASVFNTPLQCRSGRYQCLIGLIEHICARAIFQVWHFLGEIAPSP